MSERGKRGAPGGPSLVLIELRSAEDVARQHKEHLNHGGAFGPPGGEERAVVSVLLAGPAGVPLEVPARVVYCGAEGTGYEIIGFGPALKKQIEEWVATNTSPDALDGAPTMRIPTLKRPARPAAVIPPVPAPVTAPVPMFELEPAPEASGAHGEFELEPAPEASGAHGEFELEPAPDLSFELPPEELPADATENPERRVPRNVFERVRGLSITRQLKLARDGELPERVALERISGKAVWEAILRNPRVTPPEIARIARMGTLPTVQLELIVNTAAWLRAPEVRRALLSNPKLSADMAARVLALLPKHELRLVPLQTAYPTVVRDAARRMLPKA